MRRRTGGLILLAATAAQAEPPTILSAKPDKIAVTFYRDPDRSEISELDKNRPSSFALITETRTVVLPMGTATIRFEGVAGGIVPQSAILFGTSQRQRNRDAALLSHGGLVDAFTGQQVILRRTDRATGRTTEERATIRSAADRLVISTAQGAEAVYCTGLAQTLIYPHAPSTLSTKPVLTMTTRDQPGGTVTITLAYIATGFDWDATYVGTLAEDGKSLSLLSWLTMASGDETSFPDATTAAVAGRISRSGDSTSDNEGAPETDLPSSSECWPSGTTSDQTRSPPPQSVVPLTLDMPSAEIVVTASRAKPMVSYAPSPVSVIAQVEDLGDLKLYRIPVTVSVAARSQKQVAFLAKEQVKGMLLYRSRISGGDIDQTNLLFRFKNSRENGMGEPLPGGRTILYQLGPLGRQLIGEHWTENKTIDEDVEFMLGDAEDVTVDVDPEHKGQDEIYRATIRNANPFSVRYEMEFLPSSDRVLRKPPGKMIDKPGKRVWATVLEPNSERHISYTMRELGGG